MDSSRPAATPTATGTNPAGTPSSERVSHRGYGLVIEPGAEGWEARIEDPAGHVADVVLQEQLAVDPFPSAELAQEAAEQFVDDLLAQESSY
ncbi:hypothetical protein [Cyanobium sp. NIES-981]|uniref:hypothetical protein n=1 Tax=Cyanobium sp. NIES-981 TaxID=1851505 RepID=UPI000B352B1A|nr:hypothetical protein [Cyanobium sp. NIES-981]